MTPIEQEIKTHFKYIKFLCKKYLKDEDEVELLFSFVLELVWKNKDKFDGFNFKAWTSTIVRNAFINQYNRNQKITFVDYSYVNVSSNLNIHKNLNNKDLLIDLVDDIRHNFSKKYFDVFDFHILNGYTLEDTAEYTNLPMGSIKGIIWKIRKRAKKRKEDAIYV